MGLSVQRIIAGLAILNIVAIGYFFFASNSTPASFSGSGPNSPVHGSSFLSERETVNVTPGGTDTPSDIDTPIDTDPDTPSDIDIPADTNAPSDTDPTNGFNVLHDPDTPIDTDTPSDAADTDHHLEQPSQVKAQVNLPDQDVYDPATLNLQNHLNETYQGIMNPFRVLGFYKEISKEKYFGQLYWEDVPRFRDRTYFGLNENQNYCDQADLYLMMNPHTLFNNMNFIADYQNVSIIKKKVLGHMNATNLMPIFEMNMQRYQEPHLDLDLRASMFVFKWNSFHLTTDIGREFLCAGQMYNHIPGNGVITRKDDLTGTVNAYSARYGQKPQCFDKNTLLPRSYRLNNETECKEFFEELHSDEYFERKKVVPIQYLIKIPTGAHKGTGVFLFEEAKEREIRDEFANGEKCGTNTHALVAQKYIPNPILLDKQNKFDFRMYMLVASLDPIIIYYHDGFLRVSLTEYDLNTTDKASHLTNTHLSKNKFKEFVGNESLEAELREYQMWTLDQLQSYLLEIEKIDDPNWLDNYLRPQFKKLYIHIVKMSHEAMWKHSSVYEMFGLDFMLDEDFNLWLLECNPSPQLIGTTPTKEKILMNLLSGMWEIEYAYLRSKMKRMLRVVKNFMGKVMTSQPFDLAQERGFLAKANKNYLEPEFHISPNNTWVKIYDGNIEGKGAYLGNLEDDCILD